MAGLTSGLFTWGCLRGLPRPLFSVASFSFGETVPLSLMLALSCFLLSDLRERKVVPVRLDAQHGVEFSHIHTHRAGEGRREGGE